ncbi:MAG: hypothetical protein COA84_07725 [Robiginitomaculum sp.]|nr:MAG: hypothetical protein COA84_07725 [Robiginitomaculum sp.]
MARIKGKTAPYLTARFLKKKDANLFRWGMAPRLIARGIKAFDLYTGGTPFSLEDWRARGFALDAVPVFHDGSALCTHNDGLPMEFSRAAQTAQTLVAILRTHDGRIAASTIPAPKPKLRTITALLDAYFKSSKFADKAEATQASYKSWRPAIDDIFSQTLLGDIDDDLIKDWFEAIRKARGHFMAHGAFRLLRIAINWAPKRDWPNMREHVVGLGLKTPPPKVRVGDPEEMALLLHAFDDPAGFASIHNLRLNAPLPAARPAMGDALILALWTAQRKKDILAFTEHAFAGGRLRWITSKTGKPIDLPLLGPLPARIRLALARKRAAKKDHMELISTAHANAPYRLQTFSHHFAQGRALAAKVRPSLIGQGRDKFNRPYKTFTFADCRDTAITRLGKAGCEPWEIAAWSNHAPAHVLTILRHYMDIDPEFADSAGKKLERMAKKLGIET